MKSQEKKGRSANPTDNDELRNFRETWRRELQNKGNSINEPVGQGHVVSSRKEDEEESQANEWYRLASKAEKEGNMGEAVRYYRQAFRANPNIEADTRQKLMENQKAKSTSSGGTKTNELQTFPEEDSILVFDETPLYQWIPKPNEVHLSHFPPEILLRVFSHLGDASSLEMCSRVCKQFYRLSHDPPLWRQLCFQAWNVKISSDNAPPLRRLDVLVRQYGWSWRKMFKERPRLQFDGIYISKNVYIRSGQTEGSYNQPFHQVVYFRYLVFHRSGTCTAALSFDPPKRFVSTALHQHLYPLLSQLPPEDKEILPSPASHHTSNLPAPSSQSSTSAAPVGSMGNRIQTGVYTVNELENTIHVILTADRKTMPYSFHILLQLQQMQSKLKQTKHQLIARDYYLVRDNSEEIQTIDTTIKPYIFTKVPRHLLVSPDAGVNTN